jgi:hypothetical protein
MPTIEPKMAAKVFRHRFLHVLRCEVQGVFQGNPRSRVDTGAESVSGEKYQVPLNGCFTGAPSGFRTPDPLIKSQLLYQLS